MHVKSRLALVGAASVLALTLNPAAAMADHGNGDNLIRGNFQGIAAKMVLPGFDGIVGGGAPWIIDRGEVRVRASGRTDVRIEGLQIPGSFFIPGDGITKNPIRSITVSLWCDGALAAQSAAKEMTVPDGDAR